MLDGNETATLPRPSHLGALSMLPLRGVTKVRGGSVGEKGENEKYLKSTTIEMA